MSEETGLPEAKEYRDTKPVQNFSREHYDRLLKAQNPWQEFCEAWTGEDDPWGAFEKDRPEDAATIVAIAGDWNSRPVIPALLEGANLSWARLEGANLRRAHLDRADLRYARLEGANLRGARLEGADLRHVRLEKANLVEAHLEGADLRHVHQGEGTEFASAHLEGADLRGAHLEGADLRNAHLEGADLRNAHLEGAKLHDAHLEGAKLQGAHLLEDAELQRAHLDDAKLQGARLRGTCLEGTSFNRANLSGADLSGAKVGNTTWAGTRISNETILYPLYFSQEHFSMNDGSESIVLEDRDKKWNWGTIRRLGSLPLFGVSYAALSFSLLAITGIGFLNQTEVMESLKYPVRLPFRFVWLLVSSFALALGSTLYKLNCPERVQSFSETEWVEAHGRPRLLYIAEKIKRPRQRLTKILLWSGAGLGAVLLVDRFVRALFYGLGIF